MLQLNYDQNVALYFFSTVTQASAALVGLSAAAVAVRYPSLESDLRDTVQQIVSKLGPTYTAQEQAELNSLTSIEKQVDAIQGRYGKVMPWAMLFIHREFMAKRINRFRRSLLISSAIGGCLVVAGSAMLLGLSKDAMTDTQRVLVEQVFVAVLLVQVGWTINMIRWGFLRAIEPKAD